MKIISIGMGLLAGALLWENLPITILGKSSKLKTPKLKLESEPLSREVKLATSFASVVKSATPSVVYITSTKFVDESVMQRHPFFPFFGNRFQPNYEPRPINGSGVIISEEGYILTNNHVVSDSDDIVVTLKDRTKKFPAKLVGADPHTDIAVIKIESPEALPAIALSDSDTLEIGDVVLAIGNPFGVGQTVTMGIVSATGRSGFGMVNVGDFIQTDAAINPGNSGGALVDAQGRLVGINTLILSRTGGDQGIGFAVPINMARGVMDQIIEFGDVQRGLLGIRFQQLDDSLAKQFSVKTGQGILVSEVFRGGPAEKAGIQPGDIILSFGGEPIFSMQSLHLLVAETRPNTLVELIVLRNGEEKTMDVIIGKLPDEGYDALETSPYREQGRMQRNALDGVAVRNLTPSVRREFQLPRNIQGILVARVERGSPSYQAGLRRGDVIFSIEKQPISNVEDALRIVEGIEKKSLLLRVWNPSSGSRYVVVNATRDLRR